VILSGRTLAPLGQVSNLLGRFNQAMTAYANFGQLMQKPVKELNRSSQVRIDKIKGQITISNVSLTYPEQKEAVIKQVNLNIASGEKIAIVGKIASGKTSLLRLITGLYDPSEGSVKIDQSDITHLHPDDIRNHIGVVMQVPMLFSGTLKENLLMGNPNATDKEMIAAAKISNVDEIASNLPDGYETLISEGGKQLSGGQRQAICIARAFVGDPKIIIMDEPSSSMDSGSEQQLLEALKEKLVNKTLILITHRGTLLSLVSRVVVFDQGRILADGPKEKVLQAASQQAKKQPPQNSQEEN
jgi:ATP-binding cassette subfamily C protein LapB